MDNDQLRERLTTERERLEGVKESIAYEHSTGDSESEELSELSTIDQHPADVGTETYNREQDFSVLEQVEAELGDIEDALRRIDDGNYGKCQACGKQIDDARLEAVPTARFCVEDQSRAEFEARRTTSDSATES